MASLLLINKGGNTLLIEQNSEVSVERICKDIFSEILGYIKNNTLPKPNRPREDVWKGIVDKHFEMNRYDTLPYGEVKDIVENVERFIKKLSKEEMNDILVPSFVLDYKTKDHEIEFLLKDGIEFDILKIVHIDEGSEKTELDQIKKESYSMFSQVANKINSNPRNLRIMNIRNMVMYSPLSYTDIEKFHNKMNVKSQLNDKIIRFKNEASVIILDLEGQYKREVDRLDEKLNLTERPRINYFKLGSEGDSTLRSIDVEPKEYMSKFMPGLSEISSDSLRLYVTNIYKRQPEWGTNGFDYDVLDQELDYEIETSTAHIATKRSLTNAKTRFNSIRRSYFDQPRDKIIDADQLLSPGYHIIDAADLSEWDQRIVAVYLLSVLHKHKIEKKHPTRVIVVFDEAARLFPKVSGKNPNAEYYSRIYEFVSDIVHIGRKRKFSVQIATQIPEDLDPRILDLPNTQIIFESDSKWSKSKFGKNHIPVGRGQCCVITTGTKLMSKPFLVNTFNVMDDEISRAESGAINESVLNTDKVAHIIENKKYPMTYKPIGRETYPRFTVITTDVNASIMRPGRLLYAEQEYTCHSTYNSITDEFDERDISKHGLNCGQIIKQYYVLDAVNASWYNSVSIQVTSSEETRMVNQGLQKLINTVHVLDKEFVNGELMPNFRIRPGFHNNLKLHVPSTKQFYEAFDLPSNGFLLGKIDGSEAEYYIPFHPNSYEQDTDEWQIDMSVLFIGNQGRGKTNLLIQLTYLLASPNIATTENTIITRTN